ncbi:SCO4225 family membrane protein [Planomonospora sp. ID82291]|uniref:SCO4225 family membrane protein n=1 Tax=Planomonospora sp. ID82291 TaxID=2738136 RepID=UPI0035AB7194
MLHRLHSRIHRLTATQKAAAIYATLVVIVGIVTLITLIAGKDSVAIWPLWLITLPMSIIPMIVFQNVSLESMPEQLLWATPYIIWIPFLLIGLFQAWLLQRLFRRKDN